jgi:hypothetical protein
MNVVTCQCWRNNSIRFTAINSPSTKKARGR